MKTMKSRITLRRRFSLAAILLILPLNNLATAQTR